MDMTAMVAAPKQEYVQLASDDRIERTVQALTAHGIAALVTPDKAAARQAILNLLPEGAQVFSSTSQTLEAIGVLPDINESGRYDAIRPKLMKLDRNTQSKEMRKLGASPDFVVGSVHAVTEQGQVLIASGSGSQLAAYSYGAGQVIWVVGTQKIVRDLATGLLRIEEHSLPLEDARLRKLRGMGSVVAKILIVSRERPGRVTLIFVKEELGF